MKKHSNKFPLIGFFVIVLFVLVYRGLNLYKIEDIPPVTISPSDIPELNPPKPVSPAGPVNVVPVVESKPKPKKVTHPVPTEGQVGYWNFDECVGINPLDYSGFKNKGFINGSVVWATSTKDGGGCALLFDQAFEYVTTSPSDSISIADDITISAWIKPTKLKGDQGIMDKTDNSAWDYSFYLHGDKLAFASTFTKPATTTSKAVVSGSEWHNVAVTRQGSAVTFYIDGANAGTTTMKGSFEKNFTSLVFGTHRFKDHFFGLIDDFRLYNRSLTEEEIGQLYADRLVTGE